MIEIEEKWLLKETNPQEAIKTLAEESFHAYQISQIEKYRKGEKLKETE